MSLIDSTYFTGSINIAGVDNSNSGNAELLTSFITRYEKEVLIYGLGLKQYNLLQAALVTASQVPSALAEPYKSLVLGKDYTITVGTKTVDVTWGGLINETNTTSLIAYYTYWYWMQNAVNRQAYLETAVTSLENGIVTSPHDNMVRGWREFIQLYGLNNYSAYDGNIERTLFEYISDQNKLVVDTFADWTFKPFENQNRFGI